MFKIIFLDWAWSVPEFCFFKDKKHLFGQSLFTFRHRFSLSISPLLRWLLMFVDFRAGGTYLRICAKSDNFITIWCCSTKIIVHRLLTGRYLWPCRQIVQRVHLRLHRALKTRIWALREQKSTRGWIERVQVCLVTLGSTGQHRPVRFEHLTVTSRRVLLLRIFGNGRSLSSIFDRRGNQTTP